MMAPQLIFGTAIFGMDMTEFQDPPSIRNLLKYLQRFSHLQVQLGYSQLGNKAKSSFVHHGGTAMIL